MEMRETVASVQAKRAEGWHRKHGGTESPLSREEASFEPPSDLVASILRVVYNHATQSRSADQRHQDHVGSGLLTLYPTPDLATHTLRALARYQDGR